MESKSLREAIAKVRGLFKLNSSDILLSDRFIASELLSTTIKFIKQATDKRKLWNSPNIFTILTCVPCKSVPLSECCGYTTECSISRTVERLPRIAEGTNFGMLIQGIYSIDGITRKFLESTAEEYANFRKLNLKTKDIFYWIQDRYLYLSDPNIEQIKISAYFEEDIPLYFLNPPCLQTKQVCPTNPLDMEFKCPGYMEDDVIKEVASKLLSTYKRSSEDKSTNAIDESK